MISIVQYDPAWRDEFRHTGGLLRKYLGEMAMRIGHIGSTAVSGLAAKDIIDIKDPACDMINGGAEYWASVTGWVLGPSDC